MKNYMQHLNHQQIAALLTRSAEQLDSDVVSSLRETRIKALQLQRTRAPFFSLHAIADHAHKLLLPHSTSQWLVTAVLLASVAIGGTGYWHHAQDQKRSHLDIAILTSDLPMEVFID